MQRLKKTFLILFTVAGSFCSAQTFTTPEVFSFKQEVFRPISYYTGQANTSIPLFQVTTPEFTIPIALSYIGGQGLRAVNPYSNVGLGWRLSAGGAITRSKNGVCDETVIYDGATLSGFFSLPANAVTNNYVRNNLNSYILTASNGTQYFSPQFEYSPDIFSFSFLGYSGYFLKGYDGEFKIQSQDIDSVEKIQSPWSWPGQGNCVGFRLTAKDGTKFTFGSTDGSIELSGGNGPGIPYQCDAWYLTKIESPNGRNIEFKYHPNTSTFIRFKTSAQLNTTSASCPVVMDSITFNGGKVVFTSSSFTQQISDIPSYLRLIDKVELKDADNQTISTATFGYSPENLQRYFMLDSLKINNKKYSFGYYNRTSLPGAGNCFGSDYWGFYNGQSEVTGPISPGYRDNFLNQTLTLPNKIPSENFSKIGILTSVTYPTGDAEYYEYESNTYSNAGIQTLNGAYNFFSEEPKKAGGLRIAKITLGNQVRKYKYVNVFDPDNPDYNPATMSYLGFSSSGILYKLPAVSFMNAEALNFLSTEGEPPIVYSKVIEFLSDKSYTEYNMKSPMISPDGENNQNSNYFSVSANLPAIFNSVSKATFVGALGKNSSVSLERGQVSEIKVFNSTKALVKSTVYKYASDPNRYNQNVASVYITSTAEQRMAWLGFELGLQYLNNTNLNFSVIHSYNIYTFPVYLEEEVETDYAGSNILQRTTQYQYNNQKLKSTIITNNSQGDLIKTSFKYPADINTGNYAAMVGKKMLNYPVEQVQLKNNTITGGKLTTYKLNGTSYVPDRKYSLELSSPFLESAFTYFNGAGMDMRYGSIPEVTYNNYNTFGNVTQVTGKNGIPTSYLWDASATYPMAQVQGVTYSQISTQDGKSPTYPSKTLFTDLTSLSPSAIINTYTYKPLVGITSQTDINGRNTNYLYDDFGRLNQIKDQDGNIIKRFCYNYANQTENCNYYYNIAKSGTFRKICGNGYFGSLVTYSVPANSYLSSMSQEDANQQAQYDVDANGQNYANANGNCTLATTIYSRIEYTDWYYDLTQTYAIPWIKFYADAAGTIPISINNITVNYKRVRTPCQGGSTTTANYTISCNGAQVSLGSQSIVWDDGIHCWTYDYSVVAGSGYINL